MEFKITNWHIISTVVIITTGIIIFYGYYIINAIKTYNKKSIELKTNIETLKQKHEKMILEAECEIQEETFQYISKEIHDNIIQVLSLAKFNIYELEKKHGLEKNKLQESILIDISKSIHDLNNISKSLDSDIINDHGLIASINFEIDKWQKFIPAQINLNLHANESNISNIKKLFLFRIFQESLNNIIKHAKAKIVNIRIESDNDNTTMTIEDNGKGFDVEKILNTKVIGKMSGIKNMRKRATSLNGNFEIKSQPNLGTQIRVVIPI